MRVAIVTPVFNDWASLARLICALEAEVPDQVVFSLFVIDDGSSDPANIDCPTDAFRRISEIEVITLVCNLGHQRAIAVGLVETYNRGGFDAVLVMDSDGEDRPSDIPALLAEAARKPGTIVCAQRQRRPGLAVFRLWYECYKFIFRLLTGHQIDFGNFCLIPKERLELLVSSSSIWNNLAATLTRSRLPLARMPADRGTRYAGKSNMNFVSLVMHGLSAMAVYSDIVMVRLMLGTALLGAVTLSGIVGVVGVKLLTNLAIPGWATSASGLLGVILVQALMLFTISAFTVLNTRSLKVVIPLLDAPSFVRSRRQIVPAAKSEART